MSYAPRRWLQPELLDPFILDFSPDFQDTFDFDLREWTPYLGTWQIRRDDDTPGVGVLCQSDVAVNQGHCVAHRQTFRDFFLKFRVRWLVTGDMGVVFRAQDDNNLYMWKFDGAGVSQLYRRVGGAFALIANGPVITFLAGTWYPVWVLGVGYTFTCNFDGVEFTAADPASAFREGMVGCRAHLSHGHFDDFYTRRL